MNQDVKRKVLAEKKAHDIVKQLLEENIDEEYFKESVSNKLIFGEIFNSSRLICDCNLVSYFF